MIISFTNVIGAIRSLGEAAQVITTNLKMWLGFETSETLGREEVVNGDFATDSDWSEGAGWDIDEANNRITRTAQSTSTSAAQGILFVSGKSYSITYTLDVSAGSFLIRLGTPGILDTPARSVSGTYTEVVTATANHTVFNLRALDGTFAGSISNVSVKELTQITPDKSGNNNVGELFTGKALDFNGSTDYVNTTGFEMAGTSFTFAFWIYPKATTYQFIMDLDVVGTDQRSILALYNDVEGTLVQKFGWYNNPGGFRQFGDPIQNEWQRVVFRVNATTVECYVNGVQSGTTQSLATSHNYSNINNSVIAGRNNLGATQRLDSSLSDFQIYNAYWSTDDIAFDYANPNILVTDSTNTGTSIAVTNLKAYWAMSEGAGFLAYDSSGEGNNGAINGATYEPVQPRIPQLGMQNWAISTPVADEITLIPNPTIPTQDILGNAVRDRDDSFNLDGIGYATIADSTSLNISNGTLQFWLKTTDTDFTILQGALAKEYIGRTNNNAWSNGGTATISTFIDNAVSSSQPLYDNDWHFYTFTGIDINLWTAFSIGDETFDGLISDVLIYDGVLTSNQIKNNYNAGLSAHTN